LRSYGSASQVSAKKPPATFRQPGGKLIQQI